MTRIPELEQELVAAAGRLRSPRRLVRPAVRAALAAAALAAAVVLAVVMTVENDDNRRAPPSGTPPVHPNAKREGVDREAGVSFSLDGRVLTVRLLASAPSETRQKVDGKRLRATCAKGFAQGPGPGPGPDPLQTRTSLWPAGRTSLSFRFRGNISGIATWCRLEDPVVGNVAFVKFSGGSTLSQAERIEQTGNTWARLFAASGRTSCKLMTQPACERVACERVSGPIENCRPPSSQFFESFRAATVEEIEINGGRAAARFSNGEIVELFRVNRDAPGGVWWIDELGARAGRGFFK